MAVSPLHRLSTTLVLSVLGLAPTNVDACDRHRGREHRGHGASTATVVVDDSSFELVGRGPDGSIRLSLVDQSGASDEIARTPKEERQAKHEATRARRDGPSPTRSYQ